MWLVVKPCNLAMAVFGAKIEWAGQIWSQFMEAGSALLNDWAGRFVWSKKQTTRKKEKYVFMGSGFSIKV